MTRNVDRTYSSEQFDVTGSRCREKKSRIAGRRNYRWRRGYVQTGRAPAPASFAESIHAGNRFFGRKFHSAPLTLPLLFLPLSLFSRVIRQKKVSRSPLCGVLFRGGRLSGLSDPREQQSRNWNPQRAPRNLVCK